MLRSRNELTSRVRELIDLHLRIVVSDRGHVSLVPRSVTNGGEPARVSLLVLVSSVWKFANITGDTVELLGVS